MISEKFCETTKNISQKGLYFEKYIHSRNFFLIIFEANFSFLKPLNNIKK